MRVVNKEEGVLALAIMCIKDTSMLDTAAEKATLMGVQRFWQNLRRSTTSVLDIVIVSQLHTYYGRSNVAKVDFLGLNLLSWTVSYP